VAAATAQQRGKKWKKKNFSKRGKQQQQKSTPICTFHLRYGEKARRCEEPCSWPENE
jgi:hypothetical protein